MKAGDNKEFWQRTAKSYGSFMKHSWKLYDTICERIRPGLTREMNVLELACGSGQLSFRLAGRVRLWEATDFSENMIVEARKKPRSSRLHFSVQDATALLYAPDSFDAVVISNALHIMPHPELALAEIKRVLKPGGILYAPTFVHGRGAGFRLRAWLLTLAGFKVYCRETRYLRIRHNRGQSGIRAAYVPFNNDLWRFPEHFIPEYGIVFSKKAVPASRGL